MEGGTTTGPIAYRLKALTDLWTGDRSGNPSRLITTGLLGSIRWWFEVLVRGLGGSACDPSNAQARCPDCQGRRCVVCELFGCTGWARKFRFDVLGPDGKPQQQQIERDGAFSLAFTPLRPIRSEEWALLDATIRLIADYAAIGGKTVYKPSDESNRRNAAHHRDYGIVSIKQAADVEPVGLERLQAYVSDRRWRQVEHGDFAWVSLGNFWCIKDKYLTRAGPRECSFNRVLGRKEDKSIKERNGRRFVRCSDLFVNKNDDASRWIAGGRGESKKVFSFKTPARTFGFIKPGAVTLDDIRERLEAAWGSGSVGDNDLLTGTVIMEKLFRGQEKGS